MSEWSDLTYVSGYPGDGFNRDRYHSLQILMSIDESYIVLHEWDYINEGIWFYKISTSDLTVAESYRFMGWPAVCVSDDICGINDGGDCGGSYYDYFGWHHPICVDENDKIYGPSCDGYGRVYRLESETWTWEDRSDQLPNDEAVYISHHPGWDPDFSHTVMKFSKVSSNPSYPYLWVNTASMEQGALGPMRVYLIDRSTMSNPYSGSSWAHPIGPGPGFYDDGTMSSPSYAKPGAFCLDNTTGRCYMFWSDAFSPDDECWLSRFDPTTQERLDLKIKPGIFGWNDSPWAHMVYDSDSDTLALQDQKYLGPGNWETYIYLWDGDLNYQSKLTIPDKCQPGNHNEDGWVRAKDSKIYIPNFYGGNGPPYYVKLYEVNLLTQSYSTVFDVPYDDPGYGNIYQISSAVYCSSQNRCYCEVEFSIYDDTRLMYLDLDAPEEGFHRMWPIPLSNYTEVDGGWYSKVNKREHPVRI